MLGQKLAATLKDLELEVLLQRKQSDGVDHVHCIADWTAASLNRSDAETTNLASLGLSGTGVAGCIIWALTLATLMHDPIITDSLGRMMKREPTPP